MWTQLAGMGLSMASSILSSTSTNENIDQINAFKKAQWEENKELTAEYLATSAYRTERAYDEATRTAIRTKMSALRAGISARGDAEVKAAALGIQGKRATPEITRDISRAEADAISDANINLKTELTNITEHFNDLAQKAIMNLNNARPTFQAGISTGDMLLGAVSQGMNYYHGLSATSKAEINSTFSGLFSSNTTTGATLIDATNEYTTEFSNYA